MGPVALIADELRARPPLGADWGFGAEDARIFLLCTAAEQQYRRHYRSPQLAD
jgi:hypothetical protein